MKVLLTGATGHIGANIARELLREGHEVVALVRAGSDRRGIEGLKLELVEGDILDPRSLERAARGVDAVIHAAAQFEVLGRAEPILRTAIEGTENVLHAAAVAGARRVVVTSSAAAVGASERADELRTEQDWFDAATVPYYQAKQQAERRAHALAKELGLQCISLLPTLVLGPEDYRVTPSMRPILDVATGKQPTFDGGLNVVSVHDVARAHVAALTRGEPGERYLIAGENLTLKELGALISDLVKRPVKHMPLPKWLVGVVAALGETVAGITKKPPALSRALVHDVYGKYAFVDGTKGRVAFSLEPVRAKEVVAETLAWFEQRGLLAGSGAPARAA